MGDNAAGLALIHHRTGEETPSEEGSTGGTKVFEDEVEDEAYPDI